MHSILAEIVCQARNEGFIDGIGMACSVFIVAKDGSVGNVNGGGPAVKPSATFLFHPVVVPAPIYIHIEALWTVRIRSWGVMNPTT